MFTVCLYVLFALNALFVPLWASSNDQVSYTDVSMDSVHHDDGTRSTFSFNPNKPLMVYIKHTNSDFQNVSVLKSRNVQSNKISENQYKDRGKGSYWNISFNMMGYISATVAICVVLIVFVLMFMHVHQREDALLDQNNSNSNMTEVRNYLNERQIQVKRYISFYFDTGLPCPKVDENCSSNSSSITFSMSNLDSESKFSIQSSSPSKWQNMAAYAVSLNENNKQQLKSVVVLVEEEEEEENENEPNNNQIFKSLIV